MDAVAELGRNLVSKHQIQPEYGDEQADAGRDCRIRLARSNSQARTADGEVFIFPVQLTTVQDCQPYPVDPYFCYMCDHTYIHTWLAQFVSQQSYVEKKLGHFGPNTKMLGYKLGNFCARTDFCVPITIGL